MHNTDGSDHIDITSVSCLARERWKLLARAIKGFNNSNSVVSIRRFNSFDFIRYRRLDDIWLEANLVRRDASLCLDIRRVEENILFSAEALIGFNNTGNVCLWPAEEIMAYYLVHNWWKHFPGSPEGVRVCELGGGMTCLGSLFLALTAGSRIHSLFLTDGNENSVRNVRDILSRNAHRFASKAVIEASVLRWDLSRTNQFWMEKAAFFDLVLAADCLFFDDGRVSLLRTIEMLLRPGGRALIFAPQRQGTFDAFVLLVKECGAFSNITVSENYEEVVSEKHERFQKVIPDIYDPDLHFPIFLSFTKL